ncbi:6-phospho-3-hexuloisomerase [Cohnella sp. AR92]|uniref:6-phospho-3-hexuloisomerase n=1 Tax=Cohnella sp. AR92 TaxID=648716 RepID=UPI000F8F71DF|nr:6-phospho-3-hexuloisomerase [Cohnella sp. AR92]RUS46893.1 6-phospho-3-hexuloisomerase [Cohnella sp. AR92]
MSTNPEPKTSIIVRELDKLMAANEGHANSVDSFAQRILGAKSVFVAGAGRSGLMGKAFAMRLMHLGMTAYVVGETITPGIAESDTLVLGSGSGGTGSLVGMAEKAKRIGSAVLLVTVNPESALARLADDLAVLPAAVKESSSESAATIQPMGSLFEQGLLLFYDAVVLKLMELKQLRGDTMFGKHANLE